MSDLIPQSPEVQANILKIAAMMIAERGLTKGNYYNSVGSLCSLGAIRLASNIPSDNQACVRSLEKFLGIKAHHLYPWNDKFERTQEEVIEAMETCAEKLLIEAKEMVHDR